MTVVKKTLTYTSGLGCAFSIIRSDHVDEVDRAHL